MDSKQKDTETNTAKITKDMVISEVLNILGRDAGMIMMEHGLHCVGCHIAAIETLEQGMLAHGYLDEDIDLLLEDLNRIAKNKEDEKDGKSKD